MVISLKKEAVSGEKRSRYERAGEAVMERADTAEVRTLLGRTG